MRRPKTRATVLITVMSMIFLCSVVVTLLLQFSTDRIRYERIFHTRDELRGVAYDAAEHILACLNEIHTIDEGLLSPLQGWGWPLEYAQFQAPEGVEVSARIEDENAKISLKSIVENEMVAKQALSMLKLPDGISNFMDPLLDWVNPESGTQRLNGANADFYRRRDPPYSTPGRLLETFKELRLIKGFEDNFFDEKGIPNDFYDLFTRYFSFYLSSKTNFNTAFELKKALGMIDSEETEMVSYVRQLPENLDDMLKLILDVESHVFQLKITVSDANTTFKLHAVVRHKGKQNEDNQANSPSGIGQSDEDEKDLAYPFEILSLKERE